MEAVAELLLVIEMGRPCKSTFWFPVSGRRRGVFTEKRHADGFAPYFHVTLLSSDFVLATPGVPLAEATSPGC